MKSHSILISALIMAFLASNAAVAKYSGGAGEPNNPYRIATAEDMQQIGTDSNDWNKNFILVNDVNLAGYTGTQFNIIGNGIVNFTGVFDGNNHKILNFTWSSSGRNYTGLFGYASNGGEIKNLGLENVNVNAGTGSYVGGLMGYAQDSTVTNCYSTGSVTGDYRVGGMVGENYDGTIANCYFIGSVSGTGYSVGGLAGKNSGTITNCHSTGSVTGTYYSVGGLVGTNVGGMITNCYSTGGVTGTYNYVGGLVGENYDYDGTIANCYSTGNVSGNSGVGGLVGYTVGGTGTITDCYSTGSVTGESEVGGLVGINQSETIINCYSTGSVTGTSSVGGLVGNNGVGGVVNSFWDIETSGQTTSAGGKGKTTAEMKTAGTYFGWNGCGEIAWTINDGNDYPHLLWEGKPGQPLPQQHLADFLDGSGTQGNPYQVSTAEQLNLIGIFPCEWDKHFILINDVNLAEYTGTQFRIIGTAHNTPFTGVFNGNGHKVWNFTWISTNRNDIGLFGLFGCVGNGGQIKDLGMENVDVNATYDGSVGGLAGENSYGGTITNCYSTGSVTGDYDVGGLVGVNSGGISTCFSTADVNKGYNSYYVGGLVGYNGNTITNCYSTGNVTGNSSVGGLVGESSGGGVIITKCYSTGSVSGNGFFVGGLVGRNNETSTVTNCYSTGSVTGGEDVGGLVGDNFWGYITNCYSTGSVTGQYSVGGLVGTGWGEDIAASFWDVNTSGQTTSDGGTGKTTAEMMTRSTFTDAGWDFFGESANGTEDIWDIHEGTDYPRLTWQMDDDLDGISNAAENGAPNGGDGNGDAIPDSNQNNVASLPNAVDGNYVTLVTPDANIIFEDVNAIDNPSPGDSPTSKEFPIGFFEFKVSNIPVGGSTTVTILLPPGQVVDTYYKYGPTTDNPSEHWYEFLWDGTTGAEIFSDRVILHFVDGQRGDDDLTANGQIVEPGAPAGTLPHGDLDGDLAVNFRDYAYFALHWLEEGCSGPSWCGKADTNRDGTVDWYDLEVLTENWLISQP